MIVNVKEKRYECDCGYIVNWMKDSELEPENAIY